MRYEIPASEIGLRLTVQLCEDGVVRFPAQPEAEHRVADRTTDDQHIARLCPAPLDHLAGRYGTDRGHRNRQQAGRSCRVAAQQWAAEQVAVFAEPARECF